MDPQKNLNTSGVPSATPNPHADIVPKIIGSFGRYQLRLCILMFLSKFPIAYHQMAIIFLAPPVIYICTGTNTQTCPCAKPQYDRSIFTNTIVMEWNLICGRKWLSSFTQTLFQLGTLIGSVFFGMASDRFGRKKPLLVAVVLQILAGVSSTFIPGYWGFTFLRFVIGLSVGGTMVITFVLAMEFIGTEYRSVIAAVYQIPFTVGCVTLTIFGFLLRNYVYFQLVISLSAVALLSYFCLVPESPRWLIAVKRPEEAITVLNRCAKANNRDTRNIRADIEAHEAALKVELKKPSNILDLFKTPNLRKNIMAMSYNWFTCSYCFYGVSQYVGQLSGDLFVNVAASSSVTLLGCILSIPLVKFVGRKRILIIFNSITAACLLILAIIPESWGSVACAIVGVVSSFIVFVVVYLYCSELFPTVVRNAAIGFSSMMARVGSMVAPFVIGLRDVALWAPPLAFAIPPLIAVFVTFLMPETKGCPLMTTIEEGEQFGKKVKPVVIKK